MIDRVTASRLGIAPTTIDNTLYDAFGQRQINTMYTQVNQYHVSGESAAVSAGPQQAEPSLHPVQCVFRRNRHRGSSSFCVFRIILRGVQCADAPRCILRGQYSGSAGERAFGEHRPPRAQALPARPVRPSAIAVPLSAFSHFEKTTEPLSITHQGQFPAITVSFNLAPNAALGNAITAVDKVQKDMHMPASLQAGFQGTAASFTNSLSNEPLLILAALVTVYIVLGVLYESFIHPITILSTLPSAGVGAFLALILFHQDLSVVAIIGIVLADRHREKERHHDGRLRAGSLSGSTERTRRMQFTRPACFASVPS